jgi:hypothetical protein
VVLCRKAWKASKGKKRGRHFPRLFLSASFVRLVGGEYGLSRSSFEGG